MKISSKKIQHKKKKERNKKMNKDTFDEGNFRSFNVALLTLFIKQFPNYIKDYEYEQKLF